MAFSSADATKIRRYLGYSQLWQFQNPRLEGALVSVGGDPDASATVEGILSSIDGVFASFAAAQTNAGLRSLGQGEVEFYDGTELREKRKLGRMFVLGLAVMFGVLDDPNRRDIFSSAARTSRLAGLG